MSLVTPENISSRPGWRATPMGRIVHPIRMRPGKPLPPASTIEPSTSRKGDEKKKRKREKPKLVRARRRTIDPTKWDSQHLKGAFLDSIIVADGCDSPPVATPSGQDAVDDQEEADPSSSSSLSEEEERDEPDASEPEPVAERFPTTPEAMSHLPPIAQTKRDAVGTDHDFNQEKLRALSLLDSMFGGLEGDQEWGGKEMVDSDVQMPELSPAQTSPLSHPSPSEEALKGPGLKLSVEEAQADSESEESSTDTSTPPPERAPTSVATQSTNTTKAKLKDLFAPQEEQGALPLTIYLS